MAELITDKITTTPKTKAKTNAWSTDSENKTEEMPAQTMLNRSLWNQFLKLSYNDNLRAAERVASIGSSFDAKDWRWPIALAWTSLRLGDRNRTRSLLNTLLKRDPDSFRANYISTLLFLSLKDPHSALVAYRRAAAFSPDRASQDALRRLKSRLVGALDKLNPSGEIGIATECHRIPQTRAMSRSQSSEYQLIDEIFRPRRSVSSTRTPSQN